MNNDDEEDYQMDHSFFPPTIWRCSWKLWSFASAARAKHKKNDMQKWLIENHDLRFQNKKCWKNIIFTHFWFSFIHNLMWSFPLKISLLSFMNEMWTIKIPHVCTGNCIINKIYISSLFEGIKWFLGAEKAIFYLWILSPKMESCLIIFSVQ